MMMQTLVISLQDIGTMGSNGHGQQMYSSRIDLPAGIRSEVIAILNETLATTTDLKTQVKQAHWNVKGIHFYQLHELFDELASELEEFIDLVAERVTALGGLALGTARLAVAGTLIPEYPLDILEGHDHVEALSDRYAIYAKHLREAIDLTDDMGDADTADLYTEVSRAIDKRLWFLEAHLQTTVVSIEADDDEDDKLNGNGKAKAKKTKAKAK